MIRALMAGAGTFHGVRSHGAANVRASALRDDSPSSPTPVAWARRGRGGARRERRGRAHAIGAARPGASLLEALLALFAGGVMVASVAGLVRADERLAYARAKRLARGEAVRIAAVVLRREIEPALAGVDIRGAGRDSIALRLFRGLAVVCAPVAAGAVPVRFVGAREPDPAKDSVLPVGIPGGAVPPATAGGAVPLVGSTRASRCGDVGPALPAAAGTVEEDLAWELPAEAAAAIQPGTPLLLFQSGTYALSDAAFRVRHGGEGRQPLTGEWLDSRLSSFALPADTGGFAHVEVALAFKGVPMRRRLRLPLRNAFPSAPGLP